MPGFGDDLAALPAQAATEYTILKQRVELDVDFAHQSLRGSTELTLQPLVKDLTEVRLQCRQVKPTLVQVGGINAKWDYEDPYRRSRMPAKSTIEQHQMLKYRIKASLGPNPHPELSIALPPKLKIQELQVDPATALPSYNAPPSLQKQETDTMALVDTPNVAAMQQHGPQFAPIKLSIDFEVENFRDGIHWIGVLDDDKRYPHMYTKAELAPGNTSCIFPCVDDPTVRCMWEIAIRCPRTLGDAFRKPTTGAVAASGESNAAEVGDVVMADGAVAGQPRGSTKEPKEYQYLLDLEEHEAAMDLTVLCVGELTEDVPDPEDDTRHTMTFNLSSPVTARHVGFAIGPFEHVDLAAFREANEEEKLGRSAVKIDGYCLPGKADELRNTAYPVYQAVDFFGVTYGSFPFTHYQMLFVDDLPHTTVPVAGMAFCNADLLFPMEVLEPLDRNTKILARAVAEQWVGVNVVAKEPADEWVVAGIAGFMTDAFTKKLFGNNEYRWAQKQASDKIYELDVERPPLQQLGSLLHIDPTIRDFVNLKSCMVLAILDRRLHKASSTVAVTRIISKIFLNAKTGNLVNGELSTGDFQRTCEKLGHSKLDPFFAQWVTKAGCPIFDVKQRFNKKKLVVEMTITQRQTERVTKPELEVDNFMREIKEYVGEVWAPEVQPVFTGPMTVRIHEADGTPYEHIIDIKEQVTKLEIPYNTKYKRLKRSRRQKERAMATAGGEGGGEGGEDTLLYCLGDVLNEQEDVEAWKLKDWTLQEENEMGQESYEWIRMDTDFEWIGKIYLQLPLYMFVSQLQQDRDVVAQQESVKYIQMCGEHQTSLSVLVRTLMDRRYFHGIRAMAAESIPLVAKDKLQEIGQFQLRKAFHEMFCFEGSNMPRPNDWSDRVSFILQCAIPQCMAKLRDSEGKVPMAVRRFFVDQLKFNDNSNNDYHDHHYVSTLIKCLSASLVVSHRAPKISYEFEFDGPEVMEEDSNYDQDFEKEALGEIERYRRIDEFISSYHNVYSITTIKCMSELINHGIVKNKMKELLEYTRAENADNVRLEAFRCLSQTGVTRKMSAMSYLLHSLADDFSPSFRRQLLTVFGEVMGNIALRDDEGAKTDGPEDLILEGGLSNEQRHLLATRRSTPEGALAALKSALQGETSFADALWLAITSPMLSMEEVAALADIAALMFEAKTSYNVALKLPQTYAVEHIGKGKLRFVPTGHYRTAPRVGLPLEDWDSIQELGLKYTSLVADDVRRRQSAQDEVEALRLRIEQAKQQHQHQVSQTPHNMPPPAHLPTPVPEKTGLKLSLGGTKRKQFTSATPREGSPKTQKVIKQQTPSALSPAPRASPGPTKIRRGSTPASAAPKAPPKQKSRIVTLKFGKIASARASSILAAPPIPTLPRPTARRPSSHAVPASTERPFSRTPSLPHSTSNGFAVHSPPGLISPSATSLASPQPSQQTQPAPAMLNIGGFRSYAPAEPAGSAADDLGPNGFDKSESPDVPLAAVSSGLKKGGVNGTGGGSGVASKVGSKSATASPRVGSPAGGEQPRKTLKLKLGVKRPQ